MAVIRSGLDAWHGDVGRSTDLEVKPQSISLSIWQDPCRTIRDINISATIRHIFPNRSTTASAFTDRN